MYVEFEHSTKHDTDEEFQKDLEDFANNVGATFIYKEEVE